MYKITLISDTHTYHRDITDDLIGGDILLFSGDLMNCGYDKEEIVDFCDWFDSVNCYVTGYYVNGIEQGLWTKTDTSGILLVEMTYINGKAKGYFTNRYKNGKLKLQGELDSNGSMRKFKFYDEYGDVKKKKEYLLRKI